MENAKQCEEEIKDLEDKEQQEKMAAYEKMK